MILWNLGQCQDVDQEVLDFPAELPVKWIKELEEEMSSLKGQPIYMTCELNKERDVVWKRNGQILKTQTGKIQINIIGMQHAVTIQNSSEEYTGVYTCEVSGQENVKTTTNVKVIGKQRTLLCISEIVWKMENAEILGQQMYKMYILIFSTQIKLVQNLTSWFPTKNRK